MVAADNVRRCYNTRYSCATTVLPLLIFSPDLSMPLFRLVLPKMIRSSNSVFRAREGATPLWGTILQPPDII
jgi:hypothetical protein